MRLLLLILCIPYTLFAELKLPDNFQANFTQKITNSKNKVINYSGKVSFSEHINFKWSYKEPSLKEVCTNGMELVVVDHDLEQVSNYVITKGINIAKILQQATLHSKNIYVANHENKLYTIQVNQKGSLHSIAYFDDLDNKVQIVFTQMNYGKGALDKQKMYCDHPADYDMIRG
ncbi:MAG: hypothetical protein DRQ78_00280 [Epsilonproteobacteria bacterium]|nr:MAG: hypothetical protein DRQ78_00280 [Campylobacterota bacterium]